MTDSLPNTTENAEDAPPPKEQRRQETILRKESASVGLAGDNGDNGQKWQTGKAKRG